VEPDLKSAEAGGNGNNGKRQPKRESLEDTIKRVLGGEARLPTQAEAEEIVHQARRALAVGAYDEVVLELSPLLDEMDKPDERLAYLRGRAALSIGFFEMAVSDLEPLRGKVPIKGLAAPEKSLDKIARLKQLVPSNVQEVKAGGEVIFRVYYDSANPWSGAILALLPRAYSINKRLLGIGVSGTPVFIFDSYERFAAFYAERNGGRPPGSWVWAVGAAGGFYFCPFNRRGERTMQDTSTAFFRSTVTHEYNHTLTQRVMGAHRPPQWFREGLAMQAEAAGDPERMRSYARRLTQTMAGNAMLNPTALCEKSAFALATEVGGAIEKRGGTGPDPYAQSYHITGFLISLFKGAKMTEFLLALRESDDFDGTVQDFTGLSPEEFSNAYIQYARQTLRAR
jgi:hypothetical protein